MMQPLCAQELLAGGDDGLADGLAGPDGAYDEWRRLYGAEWARWYGLQVRRSVHCKGPYSAYRVPAQARTPLGGLSAFAPPHV